MNWSIESLKTLGGELIKGGLPLLGTAVAGPAGGAIAALVLNAIGADSPEKAIRQIQSDPQLVGDLALLESRERLELQKLVIEQQRLQVQQSEQINLTMRAELAEDGIFKSGWRPALGWSVMIQMSLLVPAVIVAMFIGRAEDATQIIEASTLIIGIELGVLGVNVVQRTRTKEARMGIGTQGIIDTVKGYLPAIQLRSIGDRRTDINQGFQSK